MTAVIILIGLILPFALCLLAAKIQQDRERYQVYLFERGWGPHDWHEWIEHPVYKGRIVCRYCPVEMPAEQTVD
jgi:hypothetical protein